MSTSTFHIVHFEVRTLTFRCQIDSRCRLRATCIAIYTSRQTMSQTLQKNLMNKYAANLMLFSKLGQFSLNSTSFWGGFFQDTCQGNNLTSSIVDSWRICSNNLGATRETWEIWEIGTNRIQLFETFETSDIKCFLTMLSCCCKVYSQPSPTKCVGYCSACNIGSRNNLEQTIVSLSHNWPPTMLVARPSRSTQIW